LAGCRLSNRLQCGFFSKEIQPATVGGARRERAKAWIKPSQRIFPDAEQCPSHTIAKGGSNLFEEDLLGQIIRGVIGTTKRNARKDRILQL